MLISGSEVVKENKKKLCPIDAQLIDNAEKILSIW